LAVFIPNHSYQIQFIFGGKSSEKNQLDRRAGAKGETSKKTDSGKR
jgi:hypothetical protein